MLLLQLSYLKNNHLLILHDDTTKKNKSITWDRFITMVFLFLIVGFLTTANTQFQGPLKETFLMKVGNLKNTFATLITFSWIPCLPYLWEYRFILD